MAGGADAILILYEALPLDEREDAYARIHEARLREQGEEETELAKHVRSLLRVAEVVGHMPGVDDYRLVSKQLRDEGEDVESFAVLYKYFRHSWPLAREAVELSGEMGTRQVEARFRTRRRGKVVRYAEADLRSTLARAVAHYKRPPSVIEYDWWRERELELARVQGEERPNIPSDSCYRSRWKTWEAALLHFGYTPEEVALRLEAQTQVFNANADPYLPDDLPVAEMADKLPAGLPLSLEEAKRIRDCYEVMPRRTRYILTVRFGLGVRKHTLRDTAEPLALHLTRIHQLQLYALDALLHAASDGRKTTRAGLRSDIIAGLRLMAGHDSEGTGRLHLKPARASYE